MLQDITVIRDYFLQLGFEPEVADIYVALNDNGPQNISDLARHSGVERTRIYRLIDVLTENNLIEIETHYKRSILKAAPLSNMQILLSKKEEELYKLQAGFEQVQRAITQHEQSKHATQVQFYKGIEGLKQMFWNETRSTNSNVAIFYENIQHKIKRTFFERWVREFNRRGIASRSIVGDHFLESQKQWYKHKDNERVAKFESRYVSADIFKIAHSTVVYDNVVAYYNWHDGLDFGIEIYNQEIADTQRQFFELLWQRATPISNKISQQLPGEG
ncbi:MAG TPA: helix-turn-helix domain-containing protein [Candidatus Saccharimonadales bacterium]